MKQFIKNLGNVSIVPKGKWSKEQEYERLALVYNVCDNLSYVAKINVPSGVDIENREYWQPMNATGYADNNFINLTAENENGTITAYETLEEAIATILPINRRAGATLSFYNLNSDRLDRQAEFELWQFNSTDLANWENGDYWNNIYYNWNVFAGWYIGADALNNHVKIPTVGQYAYVGSNINDAVLYQCRTNGTWTNTGTKVRNYISVVVSGNITIGDNGNWFSDGKDTGIPSTPAVDEQLNNVIMQSQQHTTEIDKLQSQDVVLKSNIDSNFETIINKVDNIKTATDNKIDDADANLQKQITGNDNDIATLNTKHESLSKTVQGIAATGGASTATNVTYNNDSSGLNAENVQDAIDAVGSKVSNLTGETSLLKGIVITGNKKYSDINADISNAAGADTLYSNRAYPNIASVTGVKINARTSGTLELCVLNKIEKTSKVIDSVEVKSGLGEYNFKKTHCIDTDKECFFIQNASDSYALSQVSSEETLPVVSNGTIDTDTFKGDALVQLISYSNLQESLLEIEKVKEQTDKISTIENSIKEIEANTKTGIIEDGKCGAFDVTTKTILEGTSRFYKRIALGNAKRLSVDFTGNTYDRKIIFEKDDAFAFYVSCEADATLNIEPIIKLTGANNAYIISLSEVTEDKIKLDGNIIEPSVNDVLSGNLWYEEYVVCKGTPISDCLGIIMGSSYEDIILTAVKRHSTIYHNKYQKWSLYKSNGDSVSEGKGESSINIEVGDADFMLIQRPTTTPVIVSYNQELVKYKGDIPYYTNKVLSQVLEPTTYKSLSNSALLEILKKYVYDKYAGKSVFFVGDGYAQGVNAGEYNGYPHDFAYRHPLANTQSGASYIWSGRTVSTFTPDNILESVLKICRENGYMKTSLNYSFTEATDLQYTRSILFEDITEIDRIIGRKKAGTVIVYSVNKSTFAKTELGRVNMQGDVTECTFRTKIKAKEGECIGLDFSANFAYKADSNTFKAIDGSTVNGSPLIQVCCNRCDYLIIEGGLNDMYQRGDNPETQVPFGTLLDANDYTTDTFDDKTFCGALEHMVREAVFKLKATKLGFLIMPQPDDDIWNNQYAKAIKDVCNKYGVPYLDMGNIKRMKLSSSEAEPSRDFWCINTDGTLDYHPSAIGYYVLMNDAINSFIDSL